MVHTEFHNGRKADRGVCGGDSSPDVPSCSPKNFVVRGNACKQLQIRISEGLCPPDAVWYATYRVPDEPADLPVISAVAARQLHQTHLT